MNPRLKILNALIKQRLYNSNLRIVPVILLVICVGIFTGLDSVAMAALFIGIIAILLTVKDIKKIYYLNLLGLLIAPYPYYDFFKLTIPIIKLNVFEVELVLIIGMLLLGFLSKRVSFKDIVTGKLYWILIITTIIYAYIGYKNGNYYLLGDVRTYFIFSIFFLSLFFFKGKDSIRTFVKLSIIASIGISLMVLIMYIFRGSVFAPIFTNTLSSDSNRVGSGNQSYFIITLPIIILSIKMKYLSKIWNVLGFFAMGLIILSIAIDESRTLIVAVLINALLVYIITALINRKNDVYFESFKIISIITIIILIAGSILLFFGSNAKIKSINKRFAEISQLNKVQSNAVRDMTNERSWEELKLNPIGYGLGAKMAVYDMKDRFVKYGSFVDNAFVTVAFKMGYLGLIITLLFFLGQFYNVYSLFLKSARKFEGIFALCILICIPMYVVNGMYFTSQMILNGAVCGFTLTLFAVTTNLLQAKKTGEVKSNA